MLSAFSQVITGVGKIIEIEFALLCHIRSFVNYYAIYLDPIRPMVTVITIFSDLLQARNYTF